MIEVEIVSSPDKEALGKRTFFFDKITIGRKIKDTLIILDPELKDKEILLRVASEGVELQEGKEKSLYGEGEILKVGTSQIKILSCKKTNNLRKDIAESYREVLKKHPEWEDLFKSLEGELINLEGKTGVRHPR